MKKNWRVTTVKINGKEYVIGVNFKTGLMRIRSTEIGFKTIEKQMKRYGK